MHEKEKELLKLQEVTLVPAGQFETEALVSAWRMPDGSLFVNSSYRHESRASEATLKLYTDFLKAERVVLHGKWVFVPETEEFEGSKEN